MINKLDIIKRTNAALGILAKDLLDDIDRAEEAIVKIEKCGEDTENTRKFVYGGNVKVTMDAMRAIRKAAEYMKDNDVDAWQLAGINAMYDQINADGEGLPYDVSYAVCGILGLEI